MNKIVCELCGSNEFVKQDGMFVCQSCGTHYTVEEAKKLMVEGTVTVDNSASIEHYFKIADSAFESSNFKEAVEYYNKILEIDSENYLAWHQKCRCVLIGFNNTANELKEKITYGEKAILFAPEEEKEQLREKLTSYVINTVEFLINRGYERYTPGDKVDFILLYREGWPLLKIYSALQTVAFDYFDKYNVTMKDDKYSKIPDVPAKIYFIDGYIFLLTEIVISYAKINANTSPDSEQLSSQDWFYRNDAGISMAQKVISLSKDVVELKISDYYPTVEKHIYNCLLSMKVLYNTFPKYINHYSFSGKSVEWKKKKIEDDQNSYAKWEKEYESYYPRKVVETQSQPEIKQENKTSNISGDAKSLNNSSSQKSGGCYVATCVYGSYDCPEVWTLRRYRDYTLDKTWYGRAFIKTYYAISPTVVKWFGDYKLFRYLFKHPLDQMVKSLSIKGYDNTPYEDKY